MRKQALVVPVLAAFALSCGGGSGAPLAAPASSKGSPAKPKLTGLPALESTEIARVPAGTFGPYVGQGRDGALVVWAPTANEKRSWFTLTVAPDGTPSGAARRIADAATEIGLVAVRGALDAANLVVVSTRRTGLGEWVEAMLVKANGELAMAPRALAELRTQALWVDASVFADRTFVMWATKSDELADIYGIALNARGEPKSDPAPLARSVRAWQAAPFAGGTALGVVRAKSDRGPGASVDVTLLDADGRVRVGPVVLSADGHPELDFDLTALGEHLVVAWSDSRDGESRVYRALVGKDGRVTAQAAPLTTPLGEQALVRVLARRGGTRAFAVWESPTERDGTVRAFDIASLGIDGRVSAERSRLLLEAEDGTVPELAALSDGLSALTLAPACERDADCGEADVMPTYVRFGSNLDVLASEPLRLESLGGGPAELGWALTCGDASCFSLAALGKAPAPVFVTRLERRSNAFTPAARRLGDEARPRLRENRVIARSDALAAVALARTGSGSLAAYLTDFDPTTPWVRLKKPASDGRFEPLRAKLSLLGLRADGTAAGAPQDLSVRAHSLGGIALAAPAPGTSAEVLAGWTGVDAGQPQVFLTLVGADGSRRLQRMLTRKSGDTSDVALSTLPGGYLVAWVDERDKDPEVYASRVDVQLNRVGIEHRLTKAPGPATEVALAAAGDGVLVAWADARQPERPGESDIYLARVAAKDATPLGSERLVLETRGHSFSPVLRATGDGFLLVWLERGSPEAPGDAGLVFQALDATGAARGEPERVALADGVPAALAVDCTGDGCRFVMALHSGEDARLVAGVRRSGSPVRFRRIVSLGSKSAAHVPLGLTGDELLYADVDGEGRWRVRRALVDWPPAG
ncbi:MAG TPA: hypothetical protein VFZ53_10175 [Polyangiaceae bacterium]